MLKNNLELNNKISLALQEEPIDFFFVDNNGGFLYSDDKQLLMSKNTKDRLLEEKIINDDSETLSNVMVVDNLSDDFVYLGKIYENLAVNKFGNIYVKYISNICLMYIK